MFTIQLAGRRFNLDPRWPYQEEFCKDYLVSPDPYAPVISVTDADLDFEARDGQPWPRDYLESLAMYRKICERLIREDVILFHCSALSCEGQALLLLGPSGTGKSTHARLWRQYLGDRVTTINDDKPLLSFEPDRVRVWGTPYGGKDNLQTNTCAPVRALVVLQQAPENRICPLTPNQALPLLLRQAYHPEAPEDVIRTLELVRRLTQLPVYALGCTISREAVELCYETVFERKLSL